MTKRKTWNAVLGVLLLLTLPSFTLSSNGVEQTNKASGTFEGISDDGYFMFTNKEGKTMTFHEVADEMDVDLYDEENQGNTYDILWVKVEIEEYDDEGEATGETFEGKKITKLRLIP